MSSMSLSERQEYLESIDRQCPGLGFAEIYAKYYHNKEARIAAKRASKESYLTPMEKCMNYFRPEKTDVVNGMVGVEK